MNFKILAFLSSLLLCVQCWAACTTSYWNGICNRGGSFSNFDATYCGSISVSVCGESCTFNFINACNSTKKFILGEVRQNACVGSGINHRGNFSQYYTMCDNECEADSVKNAGIILECQFDVTTQRYYRWVCPSHMTSCNSCSQQFYTDDSQCREAFCQDNPDLPQCKPPCDSTKWTCHTYTETTQTTVASDNITCIKGTCFGLTYCEYVTRNTTECDNECGTHTEQTNEIPMTYEGACNDDNLSDDNMCSATKCIEAQGQYSLYQMCQSRSVLNGEIQLLPRMVGGGMGSCKNAGYKAENDKLNDSASVSQDSMQIPLECYQYGVNCPDPDSSYSDPEDRTPQNGCICEPFDGQKYISQIVCPDGSSSILYSSCDEWKQPPMSSSSSPESSSAAEWPASSGGMGEMGDWATYSQGEDIKAALAVIAANTSKMGNNQVIVQQNQDFLNQFAYQDDGTEPQLNVPDSMLSYDSTQVDTNGILDAIFNRLDTSNKVLDTIPAVTKVCPCLTFFSGNQNTSFANGHIQFKELVIDMADFHGFNLCTIISGIVVALASVVSFFIGFSIFKNISQ